jgi:cyclopropane fatty-acyl-phospholipid synthase-like methyltransferase
LNHKGTKAQGGAFGAANTGSPRERWCAVLQRVGKEAFGAGEYVGQESFVTAGEVLALAESAGVRAGTRVLDLCCGVGGPGLLVAGRTRCRMVGVDLSRDVLWLARARAATAGLAGQVAFLQADAARLPFAAGFDAALLFETMLAIADKPRLLAGVQAALVPGGRFAVTLEEGSPLTPEERRAMPDGDGILLLPEAEFLAMLRDVGFRVLHIEDHTAAHAAVATRLARAFERDRATITTAVGAQVCDAAITAHHLWAAWLASARVRKLAITSEPETD